MTSLGEGWISWCWATKQNRQSVTFSNCLTVRFYKPSSTGLPKGKQVNIFTFHHLQSDGVDYQHLKIFEEKLFHDRKYDFHHKRPLTFLHLSCTAEVCLWSFTVHLKFWLLTFQKPFINLASRYPSQTFLSRQLSNTNYIDFQLSIPKDEY